MLVIAQGQMLTCPAQDFSIDTPQDWDSASGFERFWGIHHWHHADPNWVAGERSWDYCWSVWRLDEMAYLLTILDMPKFNAIIGSGSDRTLLQTICPDRTLNEMQTTGLP